jgi:GRAM domain
MTVLDNDDTFALDEFYFSFFSRTTEAFVKLQGCLESKPNRSTSVNPRPHDISGKTTQFRDYVKDTTTSIRSSSPTPEAADSKGGLRRSIDSDRGDGVADAELLGSKLPRSRSRHISKAALRGLGFGSFGGGRRSSSPSPVRTSEKHGLPPRAMSPNVKAIEPSWKEAGKLWWSRGANVAEWMRQRSAQVKDHVGTMLSSPTSTINAGVGKVSQLWTGDNTRSEYAKYVSEETAKDMKDQNPEERFQSHFALPSSEKLLGSYYGYVFRTFPFYGKMYVSRLHFCFRSLLPGIKTKVL